MTQASRILQTSATSAATVARQNQCSSYATTATLKFVTSSALVSTPSRRPTGSASSALREGLSLSICTTCPCTRMKKRRLTSITSTNGPSLSRSKCRMRSKDNSDDAAVAETSLNKTGRHGRVSNRQNKHRLARAR